MYTGKFTSSHDGTLKFEKTHKAIEKEGNATETLCRRRQASGTSELMGRDQTHK